MSESILLFSHGHNCGIDFATLQTPAEAMGALGRYCQSKFANGLWQRQLAKEHQQSQFTVAVMPPAWCKGN